MATIISEQSLGKLHVAVLSEVANSTELISVHSLQTRELRNIILVLEDVNSRHVLHQSIHYPVLLLRQAFFMMGICDAELLDAFDSIKDEEHSSAYKYFDLNQCEILDRLIAIAKLLRSEPASRQAVLPIFGQSFSSSLNRLPITISIHFLIRGHKLCATVYMRSNDMWNGFLTDVLFLTFLQEALANELEIPTGDYTHIIGSAHIYEKDITSVNTFLKAQSDLAQVMPSPPQTTLKLAENKALLFSAISSIKERMPLKLQSYSTDTKAIKWLEWCVNYIAKSSYEK